MNTSSERTFDIISANIDKKPPVKLFQKEAGEWVSYSMGDFQQQVNKLSVFLLGKGIEKGDCIALSGTNSVEWNTVDVAVNQIGAILVPLYPKDHSDNHVFILNHCKAKLLFGDDIEVLTNIMGRAVSIPSLQHAYLVKGEDNRFQQLKRICKDISPAQLERLNQARAEVTGEDISVLTYTSGTTGNPKGVILTHNNICTNILAASKSDLIDGARAEKDDKIRLLSFLPLCHVFERTAFYFYVGQEADIYYAESLETIAADAKYVKPHCFNAVPRLVEKVYEAIMSKGRNLRGVKAQLFSWAVSLANVYSEENMQKSFYRFKLNLARKLIFSKWQAALGGNLRYASIGAAALSPNLVRVFLAADMPMLQGYGLSETSPGLSVNTRNQYVIGSSGRLVHSFEIKIDPIEGYRAGEGEILAKGPCVTQGYYQEPELTAQAIVDDWFYTGDIGLFVDPEDNIIVKDADHIFTSEDNVYLKITGRKKEIFKTSGGRYIVPEYIENKLKTSNLIEQAMVVGEYKKHPAALIIPNYEALFKTLRKNKRNIGKGTIQDVIQNQAALDLIWNEINRCNETLSQVERIKKITLLAQVWTPETGELTQTMKLKRRVINDKFKTEIEAMYR